MTKIKTYDNMPITAGELAHRIVNYLQARKYCCSIMAIDFENE